MSGTATPTPDKLITLSALIDSRQQQRTSLVDALAYLHHRASNDTNNNVHKKMSIVDERGQLRECHFIQSRVD